MHIFKNTVYQETKGSGVVSLRGLGNVPLSAPPEFGGDADILSPEEMFVGSINGCLMLTFLYFAKRFHVEIASYHSDVEGEVEKGKDGFKFVKVNVKARVSVVVDEHSEKIEVISHLAEKYCLVSGSVTCPVNYKVDVINRTS